MIMDTFLILVDFYKCRPPDTAAWSHSTMTEGTLTSTR